MGLINTTGYFKGTIISGEFSKAKSGLPQEIWILKALEIYDEENQEYLPVDDEHDEIIAYLTLINHDDSENFNGPQVKKLTGWDGADFGVLAAKDLAGIELSFSVEYGKGDYADSLGVGKVDEPDATPGRTVSKLAKEDVQALQTRYAPVLAATKTATKAVSAKGEGKGKKPGVKPPKVPKTTPPKTKKPVGKCTDQEAYNACYALSGATEGDEVEKNLNDVWQAEVAMLSPDEATITPEQWFKIKERVLKQTSKV